MTMLPFFLSSGKVPDFKQLQTIMRSNFMIDGQLIFNILIETPA